MKNILSLVIALLLGLVVGLSVSLLRPQALPLGGQTNFSGPVNSDAGYQESGVEFIDTSRNASLTALRVSGGSSIQEIDCSVTSVNFLAVSTSTPQVTSTAATGLDRFDAVFGSLSTSTAPAVLVVGASSTDIAMATLFIPDGDSTDSINLDNASLTICWFNPDD